MLLRLFFGMAALLAVLCGAATAVAEPTFELAKPAAATCVSEKELAQALTRAGLAQASDGASNGERAFVSVEGTPDALTVVVRRAGVESSERLAPATCETATDVVAAFVVSALAPAPVLPPDAPAMEPKPELDVRAVARAVLGELEEREITFAKKGIRLEFSRDRAGRYVVRLDKAHSPECSRLVVLGTFDELDDAIVRRITNRTIDAIEAARACLPGTWQERARLRHLKDELDSIDHAESRGVVSSALFLGLGSATLVLVAVEQDDPQQGGGASNRAHAFLVTAAVTETVGGVAGLALPQDYRRAARTALFPAFNGAFWAWFTEEVDDPRSREAATALMAGGMTTAGLITLSAALRRPPVARLRAASSEFGKAMPSATRMAEAERDLRGLDPAIPNLVSYAPMAVSGALAMVPALEHGFADKTLVAFAGGATTLFFGVAYALSGSPWTIYRKNLETSGLRELSLGPGPGDRGGLTISGSF